MANPTDGGAFEQFITDRIDFETGAPRIGNSGDFEQFVTDRIDLEEYVAVALPTRQWACGPLAAWRRTP